MSVIGLSPIIPGPNRVHGREGLILADIVVRAQKCMAPAKAI